MRVAALMLTAAVACGCEKIYTDQSDCPRGVELRFVYDYNMEYSDSFNTQVDCLTVHVFDSDGNHVDSFEEMGAPLTDENYRMTLDLDEGRYSFVVYGGMACELSSFKLMSPTRAESDMEKMYVSLDCDNSRSENKLHDLFHGMTEVYVRNDDYVKSTVKLTKNTNNLRVVLQQLSGEPLDSSQFHFEITDDNSLFAFDNSLVPTDDIHYLPWATDDGVVGSWDDTQTPVAVAAAEFSISRLTTGTSPRLTITENDTQQTVLSIPLREYLLLLRSQLYDQMDEQEFLDRQSRWSLIFFLDKDNRWAESRIVINDWVVRINDTNL